ncbi:MAG: exodeoxyribonuclease VII large subunit [Parcubacteria group bacterium]|nr:exodeoxyribonuclease VII large subunit [Parcubacteria group bacterium]
MTKVFSVSEFISHVNDYLVAEIGEVVIQGEVTGFRLTQGKFIFFELKDDEGRLTCFALRWEVSAPLEDGMEVRVTGVPSLFRKSGGFHIRVSMVEPVGEGALKRAYELLKAKLETEGLFREERKRRLPPFPERIGLITSPDAAAYTDVLRILGNRWSGLTIRFVPVSVQGKEAVKEIVRAFSLLNEEYPDTEVVILTRGGGSLEDLWAFNTEEVVRAIFASKIPVVVGVGHERDTTLADLVADRRAATPSNAAELVVPDRSEIASELDHFSIRLSGAIDEILNRMKNSIDQAAAFLSHYITDRVSEARELMMRFGHALRGFRERLSQNRGLLTERSALFGSLVGHWIKSLGERLTASERAFRMVSPEATLKRGYSIVRAKGGSILKRARDAEAGDDIDVKLAEGGLEAEVTAVTRS